MNMQKRGQITIFIIIALLIVAGVILVLIFGGKEEVRTPPRENPKPFIQDCIKETVENTLEEVLEKGGILNPDRTVTYQGEKYTYLCHHGDYARKCINNYPILEGIIEEEIRARTEGDAVTCFESLEDDVGAKGFLVSSGELTYEVDVAPKSINLLLEKDITLTKEDSEEAQSFNDFSAGIPSDLHDLVSVTREIVNSEASNCYFDATYYTLLYPQFTIERTFYNESRLYRVSSRETKESFKFAVRSCVIPPGAITQ